MSRHSPDREETAPSTSPEAARRRFLRRLTVGASTAAATGVLLPAIARGESVPFGAEPFIGEITMFAGTFAPRGWAFCEGQTVAISSNQALFSIIGTNYGGDGRTNFKLPDLTKQARGLGGVKYIIALQGVFPPRS